MKTQTMFKKSILLALSTLALSTGCGRKNMDDNNVSAQRIDSDASSVEAVVNTISAISDDSDTSTSMTKSSNSVEKPTADLGASSVCGRVAAVQACSALTATSSQRAATFDNCTPAYSATTVTGNVLLSYNSANCSISNNGDSVSRSIDMTYTGAWGHRMVVTSLPKTVEDFAQPGQSLSIGGGGKLTRVSGGWSVELMGRNIQFLGLSNQTLLDISLRTNPNLPVQITGTLSRANRVVDQGQIEIYHNIKKYVAKFSARSLRWSSASCHPISGFLDVDYAGSRTGHATVEFTLNDTATLTNEAGEQQRIQLKACE